MSLSTLYFENCLASISAHPAGYAQLIYHAGKYAPEDLSAVLQHTGELLRRRRWHRLLEDQRQLLPPTAEQQGVISAYWQDQARVLNYSLCVATVLARDVFARLAAATLRHELKTAPINYHLFTDTTAASSWLQLQAK